MFMITVDFIQFAYPTYSGSSFFSEITIMIHHYVIHPHFIIRNYVIHLMICLVFIYPEQSHHPLCMLFSAISNEAYEMGLVCMGWCAIRKLQENNGILAEFDHEIDLLFWNFLTRLRRLIWQFMHKYRKWRVQVSQFTGKGVWCEKVFFLTPKKLSGYLISKITMHVAKFEI